MQSRRGKSSCRKLRMGNEAQMSIHKCWQERAAIQRKSCLKQVSTSEVQEDASLLKHSTNRNLNMKG